jgi:hypothetical protein
MLEPWGSTHVVRGSLRKATVIEVHVDEDGEGVATKLSTGTHGDAVLRWRPCLAQLIFSFFYKFKLKFCQTDSFCTSLSVQLLLKMN